MLNRVLYKRGDASEYYDSTILIGAPNNLMTWMIETSSESYNLSGWISAFGGSVKGCDFDPTTRTDQ